MRRGVDEERLGALLRVLRPAPTGLGRGGTGASGRSPDAGRSRRACGERPRVPSGGSSQISRSLSSRRGYEPDRRALVAQGAPDAATGSGLSDAGRLERAGVRRKPDPGAAANSSRALRPSQLLLRHASIPGCSMSTPTERRRCNPWTRRGEGSARVPCWEWSPSCSWPRSSGPRRRSPPAAAPERQPGARDSPAAANVQSEGDRPDHDCPDGDGGSDSSTAL